MRSSRCRRQRSPNHRPRGPESVVAIPEWVVATANPDKLVEFTEILGDTVTLLPRPDVPDVVEDAPTLEGNARLKAQAILAATGKPALADDTGLEVDALDGRPGVYSARYAGEDASYADNVTKLLGELAMLGAIADAERGAQFRTVTMVIWPDGKELVAEGVVRGHIAHERGGAGGFGYDPVFVPDDGDGRRFAEMTPAEKHAISHRGRALRALRQLVTD